MGTRVPSHQLSNGLYVSGQPDHPTPGSPPVLTTEPITPIKTSGSDPVPNQSGSGQMIQLQPTGLITSRSLEMSGENGSGRAGDPDTDPAGKTVYGSSVTTLGYDEVWLLGVRGWRRLMLVVVMVVVVWNCGWKKRGLLGYLKEYPDDELRGAVDGQFVKITGIVTCGSIPLESSFQKVERCVYVSTELFEHKRGTWKLGVANRCCFSWGCSNSEKYVADFYISDSRSGLRALVKAGYGAKVAPFVKEATVVDITKEKRELSPRFLEWLADRSLSSDDRLMRLKEGYIKEGSTVSVMGVVRRHDNVLMIVPPSEPMSTGCRWFCGLLPTYVEGLVLTCDENQSADVLPV